MEVLDRIPFSPDLNELLAKVHVEAGSEDGRAVEDLLRSVAPSARPRAVYDVRYIRSRTADTVDVGGVVFTSRTLCRNLAGVERIFPFIVTCGPELGRVDIAEGDLLGQFWLETIKGMALSAGRAYLWAHLKRRYAVEEMSSMSPGAAAVDTWPIEQQRELFSVFGNVEKLIGVRLTDSCLMLPNKSVSGICFPARVRFESCQVCPRDVCPGRKAPYDRALDESLRGE